MGKGEKERRGWERGKDILGDDSWRCIINLFLSLNPISLGLMVLLSLYHTMSPIYPSFLGAQCQLVVGVQVAQSSFVPRPLQLCPGHVTILVSFPETWAIFLKYKVDNALFKIYHSHVPSCFGVAHTWSLLIFPGYPPPTLPPHCYLHPQHFIISQFKAL